MEHWIFFWEACTWQRHMCQVVPVWHARKFQNRSTCHFGVPCARVPLQAIIIYVISARCARLNIPETVVYVLVCHVPGCATQIFCAICQPWLPHKLNFDSFHHGVPGCVNDTISNPWIFYHNVIHCFRWVLNTNNNSLILCFDNFLTNTIYLTFKFSAILKSFPKKTFFV